LKLDVDSDAIEATGLDPAAGERETRTGAGAPLDSDGSPKANIMATRRRS
jgi:hypothetical protein